LRRDRNVYRLGQIHAAKDDAGIGRSRTQGQLHPLATVQAHANGAGQGFESSLLQHVLILPGEPLTKRPIRKPLHSEMSSPGRGFALDQLLINC
jgi:hypothetical protein